LAKEKVLIIGLGEIGHPLFALFDDKSGDFAVSGLDLEKAKMRQLKQTRKNFPHEFDTVHICLPCTHPQKFTDIITDYFGKFKPKLIIINSTVPPGTTMKVAEKCNCLVVHSPARGVHKNLEHMIWEIKRWPKYVGGATASASKAAGIHFKKLGLKVKILKSCKETELAKLFETTYRAWMIACFQEMHRISRAFGADFDETVDFLEDTHRKRFDRPIMFPDVIGGHCLIPNTELLLQSYDSEFLRLILKSNEQRKEEVKDASIRKEVKKTSLRAKALENEISQKLEKCE
jgi:UDP-N-acetyl-D-mannosaminuronate dehydrogenase